MELRQEMGLGLLAAALAVQEGLVTPQRAAAVLADAAVQIHRDWFDLLQERQSVNPNDVARLQTLLNQYIALHAGDVQLAVQQCIIDPELRAHLEQVERPEFRTLLSVVADTRRGVNPSAATQVGDRYITLASHASHPADGAADADDPYTTGFGHVSAQPATQSSSAPSLPATENVPSQDGAGSSGLRPTEWPVSPTEPEQRVLKSESILEVEQPADYATQAPKTPQFNTLNRSTVGPQGEFATLPTSATHVEEFVPSVPQRPAKGPTGQDLSRFRVLRDHAKGGLGKVSVAEDLELHREVAFKEIQRQYSADEEARARFLLEAEITGGLEHPGIVPVYGLGTYADGRPYYAMRFIRGRSFQQAIEQFYKAARKGADAGTQQVEFRQLLRRFIDVCHALDYAHNRGIIHRDIKPGNIMLGDFGETLVVDWGIAKSIKMTGSLFQQTLTPLQPRMVSDASQTMMGVAIGTPQFMSPEQARGRVDELGPASDVYSLGATLYCLLTGTVAFHSRDYEAVLKLVKSGTFPAPLQVNPKVPKALNAICLKAMALQPALRYGSAGQMAQDIENWLADEPVRAYTESRWEQFSRWLRRHQTWAQAVAASVLVIAVVSTVAALLIDQSRRAEAAALVKQKEATTNEFNARKAEERAKMEAVRRSRQTREAVDTLLTGVSDVLSEFPGMQDSRRRLLLQAARDYSKLADEKSTDVDLRLEAARSLVRLGDVYSLLNQLDDARKTFSRADQILVSLPGDATRKAEFEYERAVAMTRHGDIEMRAAKLDLAKHLYRDAADRLNQLILAQTDNLDYQEALAMSLIGLGKSLQSEGLLGQAESHLYQAMSNLRQVLSQKSTEVRVVKLTAHATSAYGRFLFDAARPADASRAFSEAVVLLEKLVADNPDDPEQFAHLARLRINLADSLRLLGEWQRVVQTEQACVEDLQQVVRARPDVPQHRENLAVARLNLGQSLRKLGNNTGAIPFLRQAVEDFTELAASYPVTVFVESLANSRISLAQVLSELGQQDEALEQINLAIGDYKELIELQVEPDGYLEGLGIAHRQRARILARRGDLPAGIAAQEESIQHLEAAAIRFPKIARISDHLAWSRYSLGQLQLAAGQADVARESLANALALRTTLVDKFGDSPQYRDALAWQLATCPIAELRDFKRARELNELTIRQFPASTQFQLTAGVTYQMLGDASRARQALEKSAELRGSPEGMTLVFLALAKAALMRTEDAQKDLEAAKVWREMQKPADEELAEWFKTAEAAVAKPAE